MSTHQHPIDRAGKAVGTTSALANLLGLHKSALSQWKGSVVPMDRCAVIERITAEAGKPVTVEELRPDLVWARKRDRDWPHRAGRPLWDAGRQVGWLRKKAA